LYVPLAIHLAIETGMRRQEIFNLRWMDIDFKRRRIEITKSKTDAATGNKGAAIVLPIMSKIALLNLREKLLKIKPDMSPETLIFLMTGEAFTQAFKDVVKRVQRSDPTFEDLTFHDLRRTANNRFIQAELLPEERNIMMRHADKSMNAVYIGRQAFLQRIQDKLDRFVLGGKTEAEAMREVEEEALE
jgi:integrase